MVSTLITINMFCARKCIFRQSRVSLKFQNFLGTKLSKRNTNITSPDFYMHNVGMSEVNSIYIYTINMSEHDEIIDLSIYIYTLYCIFVAIIIVVAFVVCCLLLPFYFIIEVFKYFRLTIRSNCSC